MDGARRILHCCCNTGAAELDAVIAELRAHGLTARIRSGGSPTDASLLGMRAPITSWVALCFDDRGPRSAPAVEVQGWADPEPIGRFIPVPQHLGIRAVGIATPHLESDSAASLVTVVPHDDLAIDLVHDTTLTEPRLRHVRISCADIDTSLEWWCAIGARQLGRTSTDRVERGWFAATEPGTVRRAVVQFPDEATRVELQQWLVPEPIGTHPEAANTRGWYRIALAVDDVDALLSDLGRVGIRPTAGPQAVELPGTNVPTLRIAVVHDPVGVPVELIERPRAAFRDAEVP